MSPACLPRSQVPGIALSTPSLFSQVGNSLVKLAWPHEAILNEKLGLTWPPHPSPTPPGLYSLLIQESHHVDKGHQHRQQQACGTGVPADRHTISWKNLDTPANIVGGSSAEAGIPPVN